MRIVVTSVLVDDQDKALRFYTDVLGLAWGRKRSRQKSNHDLTRTA